MRKVLRFLAPPLAIGLASVASFLLLAVLLWLLPDSVKTNHAAREAIATVLALVVWLPLVLAIWLLLWNGASPRAAWRQVLAYLDRFF